MSKFKEGFVFGAGFSVAFILISYAADFAISPTLLNYKLKHVSIPQPVSVGRTASAWPFGSALPSHQNQRPFHEMTPDEQIKNSSAIVLATYEKRSDGRMAAVAKEFLKTASDVIIHYKVGDEISEMSYYPSEHDGHGDGALIFFTGSPAMISMSMTYSGNRITGLGNMPLELLRSKCKAAAVSQQP